MAIGLDEGVSDADADERDGGAHDEDPRDAVRAHRGDRAEGVGAQQRAQLAWVGSGWRVRVRFRVRVWVRVRVRVRVRV